MLNAQMARAMSVSLACFTQMKQPRKANPLFHMCNEGNLSRKLSKTCVTFHIRLEQKGKGSCTVS